MQVSPDDEIYQVDEVFLGPDRFRFPWRWTYRQYGVALVTFLATQAVERQLGIAFGLWPAAFALLITIAVTRWVHDGINPDRGLKTMTQEAWLEITGPRTQNTPVRTVLTVAGSARKQRARQLAENYGTDEDNERAKRDTDIPSWWSQFRPTRSRNCSEDGSPSSEHSDNHDPRTRSTGESEDRERVETMG
ncbi:hypothetical protein SAMN04487819_1353, partial [Actinopolyspora alba]